MDNAALLKKEAVNPAIINLDSLLNLSANLNELTDELKIYNSALLSLMGKLRFARGYVLVNDNNTLRTILFKGADPGKTPFPIGDYDEFIDYISSLNKTSHETVFVVSFNKKIFALICLNNRLGLKGKIAEPLSSEELRYAELLTQITANALQNARSHNGLLAEKLKTDQRNQLLTTLFEVTRDFSTLLSREQIIKMLSLHLMGQLMVNRFAVLIDVNNQYFEPLINRFEDGKLNGKLFLKDKDIFTSLAQNDDIPEEIRFIFPEATIVSPMIVQGKTKGLLLIGKSMGYVQFDDLKLHFISALGNTAMASLENERLFQEELIKISIENELMFALEIQKNLLPKEMPNLPGFDIAGKSLPSRHVGGDYFDFIALSETKILVAIADVSGKGMPASLIMANVQAALRVLAPMNLLLPELVFKLNNLIYSNTSSDKFITFFIGVLDTETARFNYINAGHNPPVLFNSETRSMSQLTDGGLILGVLEDNDEYLEGVVDIATGDVLLLYTDGITESMSDTHEEYGTERLEACLLRNLRLPAENIIESIIDEVTDFSTNNQQYDDLTLIVVCSGGRR